MKTVGRSALAISALIFVTFLINAAVGGANGTTFLGDIAEAVVLFASVVFFVVAILCEEAVAKAAKRSAGQQTLKT